MGMSAPAAQNATKALFFSLQAEEFCESLSSWIYAGTMKAYI